jgi:hypothetical protein
MDKETIEKIICKTGQDLFQIKKAICIIFDNFECNKFDKDLRDIIIKFKEDLK